MFLASTRKGLLKNVQDGICTPLGSREIQKTKLYAVLFDTLYQQLNNCCFNVQSYLNQIAKKNVTANIQIHAVALKNWVGACRILFL